MPPPRYAVRVPDPDNPTRTLLVPLDTSDAGLRRVAEEDPEAASFIESIDPDQARALAEEQDILRRQDVIREMPIFGRLATAGIGFANELFMGLPGALMDDEERRTLEAATREFGTSNIIGRLGGALAPAIATGGATLAESRGAALLPGVFSQALGNSVERAVLARLGGSALSNTTRRALAFGAGATADGAVSGLQEAITEANIRGTPLDAEMVLANVGLGSALGLGVGGVFGGLRAARGAIGRRMRAQLRRQVEAGTAPRGVTIDEDGNLRLDQAEAERAGGALPFLLSNPAARFLSGLNAPGAADDIRVVMADPARAIDNVGYTTAAQRGGDLYQQALREAEDLFDPLRRASQRQSFVRATDIDPTELDGLRTALRESVGQLDETAGLRRVASDDAARLRELGDTLRRQPGTPEELATNLDDALDRIRTRGVVDSITDPDARAAAQAAVSTAESALERLGPGARLSRQLQRDLDAYDRSVRNLRSRGGAYRNVRLDQETINPGTIFTSVSDSGFRVMEDLTPDLERLLNDARQLVRRSEEAGVVPPQAAQSVLERTVQAAESLDDLKDWGRKVGAMRNLSTQESQGAGLLAAGGVSGIGLGSLIGLGVGGPVGALAGAAGGLAFAGLTHPTGIIRRMAAFSRSKGTIETRMTEGVENIRKALQSGRRMRRVGRGARQVPRTVLALRSPEERQREYEELKDQVLSLAGDPETAMQHVGDMLSGVSDVAPEMADTMAMRSVMGVQYLAANLPPSDAPSPFDHLRDLQPSQVEMDAFVRRFQALEDPMSILDLAAEHRLQEEHVEAVSTVYPELYAAIQTEITNMIGELEEMPPYAARTQLGTLLNVPTDPSLTPEFLFAMQQNYAQTEEQDEQIFQRSQQVSISQDHADNTYSETQEVSLRL